MDKLLIERLKENIDKIQSREDVFCYCCGLLKSVGEEEISIYLAHKYKELDN